MSRLQCMISRRCLRKPIRSVWCLNAFLFPLLMAHIFIIPAPAQTGIPQLPLPNGLASVPTYHNDPQRTGWNANETILNPGNVNAQSFGLLAVVKLDGRVDAQPLVVANEQFGGTTIESVVYVVTENNTVYAIDGSVGRVLIKRNLGPVMTTPAGPGWCTPTPVGVNSTPTIDLASRTLYVMVATTTSTGSQYQLHALDLMALTERNGSPVTVQASALLDDGTQFAFNASYQRQRPALLENSGNIYAAFGSFGDCFANLSRGWVLGWNKSTLAPLAMNEVANRIPATATNPYFLSSIWMSGYGLAADSIGDLYFATGNSASGSYNETVNVSESAVRLSGALGQVLGVFTPSNVNHLDAIDGDFGSGGVMVVPDQNGLFPHLALAGGKDGRLFVLNRDSMGGHQTPDVPNQVQIGECWCGPSYFDGPNGPLVITSGGTNLSEWSITTQGGLPSLSLVAATPSAVESSLHDPGFFTSVSSNGTLSGSAIIWAVGHGPGETNTVTLHAFNATPSNGTLTVLWSGLAGVWWWSTSNPNIVPTVANGRVYVASIKELEIFGLMGFSPLTGNAGHN